MYIMDETKERPTTSPEAIAQELSALRAENDRLHARIEAWIDMTVNCAGVPQNPDSLPQMLLHEFRAAIAKSDPCA